MVITIQARLTGKLNNPSESLAQRPREKRKYVNSVRVHKQTKLRGYMYQVIDNRTKAIIGVYKTLRRANRKADQLDLIYGAIRYQVRKVQ
jgi:hypothetical protein